MPPKALKYSKAFFNRDLNLPGIFAIKDNHCPRNNGLITKANRSWHEPSWLIFDLFVSRATMKVNNLEKNYPGSLNSDFALVHSFSSGISLWRLFGSGNTDE